MSSRETAIRQMDALLQSYPHVRGGYRDDRSSDSPDPVVVQAITRLSSAIERLAAANSSYRRNAQNALSEHGVANSYTLELLAGMLRALREDYAAGYLQGIEELVHAELFSDFLEMAEHLLAEGYKDPAAVMAGSVIEEHLRKLCDRNGVLTQQNGRPKKADGLNAELAAVPAYSKLDQKSVIAWLDLRNKAAHGHYNEYTKDQVTFMLMGVRDFIARNPA